MIEFLYSIDISVFYFINRTISNPVTDYLWPLITEYNSFMVIRILLLGTWVLLIVRGGARGRTVAVLCVLVLALSDQLSSTLIKALIARPRPCHEVGGAPVLQGIHLLVNCGSGKSFPSSHAVNNFAMATLFAYYYRRWTWAFFAWAALVALSRVGVGVHYPSDILGGAIIGTLVSLLIVAVWTAAQRHFFPRLDVSPNRRAASYPQKTG